MERATKPDRYEFTFNANIENSSDQGIMLVGYRVTLLDADGKSAGATGLYRVTTLLVPNKKRFVVFAGNLRREGSLTAKLALVPCVVYAPEKDEDFETVKRRAIKDNGSFGS